MPSFPELLRDYGLLGGALFVWWLAFLWVLEGNKQAAQKGGVELEERLVYLRELPWFSGYKRRLAYFLTRVSALIGDHSEDGHRPFSAQSFLFSYGISVAYPILLAALTWLLLATEIRVGLMQIAPAPEAYPDQVPVALAFILLAFTFYVLLIHKVSWLDDRPLLRFVLPAALYISSFFYVVTGNIVAALLLALNGSFLAKGPIAGATAGAFVTAFAYALVFVRSDAPTSLIVAIAATSFAVGLAIHWISTQLDERGWGWLIAVVMALSALVAPLIASSADTLDQIGASSSPVGLAFISPFVLLFFFVLVPAVNGLWDWISLETTRVLLWRASRDEATAIDVILIALVDLILAFMFTFAVAATTAAFLTAFDVLHVVSGGRTLIDVPAYLADLERQPGSIQHWWVYLVIFSTFVPTILHAVVALGALIVSAVPWRFEIAALLESSIGHLDRTRRAVWFLSVLFTLPFVIVALLLYAGWILLPGVFEQAGLAFLQFASAASSFTDSFLRHTLS